MSEFINITISKDNLDRYCIRNSIFTSLNKYISNLKGNLLDVGCGKMPYKNHILSNSSVEKYIGLDIEDALEYDTSIKPNYTWNGNKMPFNDDEFDCALATEVLEHCPEPEVVLKEIFRVLKPEGFIFFTVPFLWNLHEVPNDQYRYTPFSLERHLRNSGFFDIEIKASGGWHAAMAQMLGLWVKRSPMTESKRKILSILIKPLMVYLLKLDSNRDIKFINGQMITGLYGIAKKK